MINVNNFLDIFYLIIFCKILLSKYDLKKKKKKSIIFSLCIKKQISNKKKDTLFQPKYEMSINGDPF
jgi:hypothetical protein